VAFEEFVFLLELAAARDDLLGRPRGRLTASEVGTARLLEIGTASPFDFELAPTLS
jgi:hypothetical protein